MSNQGKIVWTDLTVKNATEIKEFYAEVLGWKMEPQKVDDYEDFNVKTIHDEVIAGICHAKGSNKNMPPVWLNYVQVEDVDHVVLTCKTMGGKIIDGPRKMGQYYFAVIQDPAEGIIAVIQGD